ncbi:MAG: hypothetical protein ACLR56_11690 [Oscillospiraceae bacterium]
MLFSAALAVTRLSGQVLCKPGSIHPHQFRSGYVLTKRGRPSPVLQQLSSAVLFQNYDVTGVITLPEGTEMCMPGDNVEMDVELITPIAIEEGLRFAIREGGRTVGSGVVTKLTLNFNISLLKDPIRIACG